MSSMREREAIAHFWRWFEDHRDLLEAEPIATHTIQAFEQNLSSIELFDWDVSHTDSGVHALTLSPFDRAGLNKARRILAAAPVMPGWKFEAGKPAKQWALTFEMQREGRTITIDGTAWEFVIIERASHTFDVVLKPPDSQRLSEAEADCAAVILVDGEVGEVIRLEKIGTIETTEAWGAHVSPFARKLEPGLLAEVLGATPLHRR